MTDHDQAATPQQGAVDLTKPPGPGPAEDHSASAAAPAGGGQRSPRLWSARRWPAAVTSLTMLAATGALLIDVLAVRTGRHAAPWRRHLADELATRTVGDVWVLTGAGVAAALGLWLIVLALSPGRRRLLPMRAPGGDSPIRAVLDRDSAAMVLRDAAMRVPGAGRARVQVRRRRISIWADARFRDPEEVREELTEVLREERDRLSLAHSPRLVVRVRRTN